MNNNNEPGQLKNIDLKKPMFTANGKEYYIESQMSIERYCEWQVLEKELAFGVDFEKMYGNLKKLYTMINKQEFANAAVALNTMITGVSRIKDQEPTILKMVALFINEKNEDRTKWSQDNYVTKIQDWKTEGIPIQDFFALALTLVPGLSDAYNTAMQAVTDASPDTMQKA